MEPDLDNYLQPSELKELKKEHKFIRDNEFDTENAADWKVRMARRYYDKLYKEFAIVDLSNYQEGKIGLRWRIESEVLSGKGQLLCGNKKCQNEENLVVLELPFSYIEDGENKMELVKVTVCSQCHEKLLTSKKIVAKKKRKRNSEES